MLHIKKKERGNEIIKKKKKSLFVAFTVKNFISSEEIWVFTACSLIRCLGCWLCFCCSAVASRPAWGEGWQLQVPT